MNDFNKNLFNNAVELLIAPASDQQSTKILTDMLDVQKRTAIIAYLKQQQQPVQGGSAGNSLVSNASSTAANSNSATVKGSSSSSVAGGSNSATNNSHPVLIPLGRTAANSNISLNHSGVQQHNSGNRLIGANAVRVVEMPPPVVEVKVESEATPMQTDNANSQQLHGIVNATNGAATQQQQQQQPPSILQQQQQQQQSLHANVQQQVSVSASASIGTAHSAVSTPTATSAPPPTTAAAAAIPLTTTTTTTQQSGTMIGKRKLDIDPKLFNRSVASSAAFVAVDEANEALSIAVRLGRARILSNANADIHTFKFSDSVATHVDDELFSQLSQFEAIELVNNQLLRIPSCIGQFDGLKSLTLSCNRLVALPDTLCNIASLTDLNVASNLIRALPDRIGHLKQLKSLDVSHNQLQTLPLSLADCQRLTDLKAPGNALLCPAGDVVARGAAHTRQFLSDLQRGQQRISRSVRLVLLGDAQSGRTALARSLVSHRIGARWRLPQGPAARSTGLTVQEVMFDRARDADEALSGNVTLADAIVTTPPLSHSSTSANFLSSESLSSNEHLSGRDDEVLDAQDVATGRHSRFFVWDFSPDFYSQLHAPLASEQQLTIVTWRLRDTRTGASPLAWLHSLAQALSVKKARGETMAKLPADGAVVVLVGTHADEAPLSHDTELINAHMQYVADELARMPELTHRINVKCILSVSSVDGTGIDELQRTLMELAPTQRQWHTEVPASWRAFEAALTDSAHRRLPIISLSAAERVAALCGVEREDVSRCLRHLHGLGRVLHFDTPRGNLRSRLMLDPLYLYNVAHHVAAAAPAAKLTSSASGPGLQKAGSRLLDDDSATTPPLRAKSVDSAASTVRYGGAEVSQARLDADLRRYAEASRPWLQIVLQHVNLMLALPKQIGDVSSEAPCMLFAPSLTRNQPPATLWPITVNEPQKTIELRRFHALEINSDAVLWRFLQRLVHCSSMQPVWMWQRGAMFLYGDGVQFFVELSWDKRVLQQSVRWTADANQVEKDAAEQVEEKLICRKCSRQVGTDGIEACGAFWCATCFVCTACSKQLIGDFLQFEGTSFCSSDCWQKLHPDEQLPEAPETPRIGPIVASSNSVAVDRGVQIDEYGMRRAGLEAELVTTRERRSSIVEQLAAAAGRVKASSKRNGDIRMTKLLAAMKQDLIECEAEITVLDRQLRTMTPPMSVPSTSHSAGEEDDAEVSVSPTPSIRLTGNRLIDGKAASGRSTQSGGDSSGTGDDSGGDPTMLRRMSSSRRDLQRSANKRPSTVDSPVSSSNRASFDSSGNIPPPSPALSRTSRSDRTIHRNDSVLHLSRRVTPVREARAPLVVPNSVVDGLRLVGELLDDSFDDIDGDAVCAVCCTTCMRVLPTRVHKFLFAEVLAALLVNGPSGTMACSFGHSPRINDLVPDYCLVDLDRHVPLVANENSAISSAKQEIGRGAFGTIFRAVLGDGVRGTNAGSVVAIKELIVAPDATVTQRVQVLLEFRTELLAMQRAGRTECLVGVHAFSTSPALALFIELAVGGTLHDALHTASFEMPWVARTRIALDVARGLAHMHKSALLHRDLKSPNVLLTRTLADLMGGVSDKAPLAKIADFGTCCAFRGVALSHRIVDQPRWLAPEIMQLAGYGLASDIYSLGITFWEIASREEPWDEFKYGSFTSQLERDCIAGRRPTIPSESIVPVAFAAVIRACWASQIAHRPTADGVCTQLEAFIVGRARPAIAIEDESLADWSRDSLLRCQLHATPFVLLAFAPLRSIVSWLGDIEAGTSDERDVLLRAMCRTRADAAARVEFLQCLISWTQRIPPELADASVGAQRRERERRRAVLIHSLLVWFAACPDQFRLADGAVEDALLQLVAATIEQLAASKAANEALKVIADLRDAFANVKKTRPRAPGAIPRVASKTIKSLWLATMPVSDLANELTLLEHGFVQEVDVDALLAWRAEHAVLARHYGDASPRDFGGDDESDRIASLVSWLEWTRRMIDWVATEVLAPEQVQGRADAITKFVQVAQHCANELRNFNTAFQIVAALKQPTITSLKRTWAALTPKVRADLDALAALLSPAGAAKPYREALAVRGKSNARVPLINILLGDLVEMRTIFDKPHDWHAAAALGPGALSTSVTPRSTMEAPSPRSTSSAASGASTGSGERHKRHKEAGSGKRRHKRKGGSPEPPSGSASRANRRRHVRDSADDVAAQLQPPKLPEDESSSVDETISLQPPPLPPAASDSASPSITMSPPPASVSPALPLPTSPSPVAPLTAPSSLLLSQRAMSRRMTRDGQEPLIDVHTTTLLATLLRSFVDWSSTPFDMQSRNDVRMLLLSVEVWPKDTLEEIARLREPDSATPSGGESDALAEAHANLPSALRSDLARLRCLLRCHASVVTNTPLPQAPSVVMNGAFTWRLTRGRVPSLYILASGTLERRRGIHLLSSHSQSDPLPLLGIEALAGLRATATSVATADVGLQEVPLGFLFACLLADSGLERAFYHGVAESLALRMRNLLCDGVSVASTPEPSLSVIEQAVREGQDALNAATTAAMAPPTPLAESSSSLSGSQQSVRPPSPPPSQAGGPVSLAGVRDRLRSLGTILRRKNNESPSGGAEAFSISAPSTFKHVEMSLEDLRTAAVVATTSNVVDDLRKRVVDSATNDLAEHFAGELHADEVVVRAYKCRTAQKRKGTLYITPLAVYFFSKSLAQTIRRRMSLFDEAISVTAPPVSATAGPEVTLLGERFAFANPALRDEAYALLCALVLPGALTLEPGAQTSARGSVSAASEEARAALTSSTSNTSMSSKLISMRDAVVTHAPSSPAPPSLAQLREQAVRSVRRTRRLAERELPLRRCLSEGDALGASLVSTDEWESLLRGSRTLQLVQGARIVKEGDAGARLYYLRAGRVRLERGEGASARHVCHVESGETFGAVDWLLSCVALTSAIVESPVAEVHVLTVSYVDKLLLLQPSTASHFYQLIAMHLMTQVRVAEIVLAAPDPERPSLSARLVERASATDRLPAVLRNNFDAPADAPDAENSSESTDSSESSSDSEAMDELLAESTSANVDDDDSSSDAAMDELLKGRRHRRKKGSDKVEKTSSVDKEKRRKHRTAAGGVSTTSRSRKSSSKR